MNIYELLSSQVMAWIQGIQTRIILDDSAKYQTLGKDRDGRYTVKLYVGNNELLSVAAFLQNEQYDVS